MNIEISPYKFIGTVEDWLLGLGFSRSRLKKYLSKSFLRRLIQDKDVLHLPIDLLNDGKINPEYTGEVKPLVVFEDENFFVLEKPCFCHNHPLAYNEKNNLLSFLRSINRQDLLEINHQNYDRALLYRLDYDTSGVIVFAKKEIIYQKIRKNFTNLIKKKIYHALVCGDFDCDGEHIHYLASAGVGGKKMQIVDPIKGAMGKLKARKLAYNKDSNHSLVEIELITGLRHQIRVQFKELGYPLVGDRLYGGEPSQRLCLHALFYSLKWDDKSYEFQSNKLKYSMV